VRALRVAWVLIVALTTGGARAETTPAETPPDPARGQGYNGRLTPDLKFEWQNSALEVPRILLAPIRLLFRGLAVPTLYMIRFDEDHQVMAHIVAAITSPDGLLGVRPVITYISGFRAEFGLAFFDRKLLGPATNFRVEAASGGTDLVYLNLRLRPTRDQDRNHAVFSADFTRRGDFLYTGIGSSEPPQPGQLPAARYGGNFIDINGEYSFVALPWLAFGVQADFGWKRFSDGIPTGSDPDIASVYCIRILGRCTEVVNPLLVPGFDTGTQFFRGGAYLRLDTRDDAFVPSSGFLLQFGADYSHGIAGDPSSYFRLRGEASTAINLWRHTRVIILRAVATAIAPTGDDIVPFTELAVLGGPDDLRGFRYQQFRDDSSLLFTGEYRWPVWMFMDGTVFADWGGVFSRWWGDINTSRMQPDILWRDPDDAPIPLPPDRLIRLHWTDIRDALFLPADHAFGLDYLKEAMNVNALDDVPDSSWFQDRRRVDDTGRLAPLAPAIIDRAAGAGEPPPVLPFTILHGKVGGSAAGFVALDARGRKYALKLDPREFPGMVTSTEVVTSRLAWAAGWIVPAEWILDVDNGQFLRDPAAWRLDPWNEKIPLTDADVAEALANSGRVDGRVRVLASRWIEGHILGYFPFFGRDKHDPNDRVPHQHRRDLRGFGIWTAWVNDIDTMENNTLDTYVGEKGRGHIVHYQQDVGGAFGTFTGIPMKYWMGRETFFMPERIVGSLLTLGAVPRPWEGRDQVVERAREVMAWPELGGFAAQDLNPRSWQAVLDNPAFVRQTARDRYWGGKRVASFGEAEVRAAIATGHYRPAAAEHLFDVLWKRREKIARALLGDAVALDWFRATPDRLCFHDLYLEAGLGGEQGTLYRARVDGKDAQVILGPPDELHVRCALLPTAPGYYRVALAVLRPGERGFRREVIVHVTDGPRGRRVVGVER
jgi:hypothetical protein